MSKKHGYSEASRDKLQSLTPENLATIRSVYVQQVLCSPFKKITSLSSIYIYTCHCFKICLCYKINVFDIDYVHKYTFVYIYVFDK